MFIGTVREIRRYPVKSMGGATMNASGVTASGIQGDRVWALRDDVSGEIRGAKQWPALMQCQAAFVRVDDARHGSGAPCPSPHVSITFPDGTAIASDDANVHARLSDFLGARVSLCPLRPASDKAHYRRRQPGAMVVGAMARSKLFRRVLDLLVPFTPLRAQLRSEFSREPGEPIPNLTALPGELLEFATPPGTYFDAFPIHLLTTASLEAMKKVNPGAAWDVRRFRPNVLIETKPGLDGLIESGWPNRSIRIGAVEVRCTIPTVRCGMTMHAQHDLTKEPSILRTIVRDAGQNLGIYASVVSAGGVNVGDPVELLGWE